MHIVHDPSLIIARAPRILLARLEYKFHRPLPALILRQNPRDAQTNGRVNVMTAGMANSLVAGCKSLLRRPVIRSGLTPSPPAHPYPPEAPPQVASERFRIPRRSFPRPCAA